MPTIVEVVLTWPSGDVTIITILAFGLVPAAFAIFKYWHRSKQYGAEFEAHIVEGPELN